MLPVVDVLHSKGAIFTAEKVSAGTAFVRGQEAVGGQPRRRCKGLWSCVRETIASAAVERRCVACEGSKSQRGCERQ